MAEHVLKTDPKVFQESWNGSKVFEIRYNDRDYKVGDTLLLCETAHSGEEMKKGKPLFYTGRQIATTVEYVLHGPIYGLEEGWVIMSASKIAQEDYLSNVR